MEKIKEILSKDISFKLTGNLKAMEFLGIEHTTTSKAAGGIPVASKYLCNRDSILRKISEGFDYTTITFYGAHFSFGDGPYDNYAILTICVERTPSGEYLAKLE